MPTPELIELRDRLENDLAAIIVSELLAAGARGFYVVLSSEVASLQLDGNLAGMTHPNVASWLRPEIGTRWRGNGPAMLLVDAADCSPATLTAKAVHELAHIANSPELFSAQSPIVNAALSDLVTTPPRSWPAHRDEAWSGHGPDFLRAVIHVADRLAARDHDVAPALLMDWTGYGYRSGWRPYFATLEAEIESREYEPISEIVRSPAPPAFLNLWDVDVAASVEG